jgi:adenylosuccinate synthase
VGYEIDGKVYHSYPGNLRKSKPLNIVYDELPGWTEDITQIKNYDELPENCKKYVEYIEKKLKCNVSIISVGPERSQNIYRYDLTEIVK